MTGRAGRYSKKERCVQCDLDLRGVPACSVGNHIEFDLLRRTGGVGNEILSRQPIWSLKVGVGVDLADQFMRHVGQGHAPGEVCDPHGHLTAVELSDHALEIGAENWAAGNLKAANTGSDA